MTVAMTSTTPPAVSSCTNSASAPRTERLEGVAGGGGGALIPATIRRRAIPTGPTSQSEGRGWRIPPARSFRLAGRPSGGLDERNIRSATAAEGQERSSRRRTSATMRAVDVAALIEEHQV